MAKVLIVDDAAFMRNSLKYIFEKLGHTVVGTASDGTEAVALYPTLKPDLVTLDILMRDLDGIATLKILLNHDPQAKVIMVTALGQESKQKEARKIGAIGYIRKPFKPEDVAAEIEEVLGKGPC